MMAPLYLLARDAVFLIVPALASLTVWLTFVFGRQLADGFQTLSGLELPPALAALCEEVPADQFREDISSSEIRAASDRPAE